MAITGSDKMLIRRERSADELGGWQQAQLEFMLTQAIKKSNWPQFLAFYLRALHPDVLDNLATSEWLGSAKFSGIEQAVKEAITIIQEANNG